MIGDILNFFRPNTTIPVDELHKKIKILEQQAEGNEQLKKENITLKEKANRFEKDYFQVAELNRRVLHTLKVNNLQPATQQEINEYYTPTKEEVQKYIEDTTKTA